MRSLLQLACHLLFISTIASSAPTPPTTTDAANNENQNVEESVQDWMSVLYQPPTAEENHRQTMDATFTVEEAFQYAMEVSRFESAASNNVLLEHQDRLEANQAQPIQARLEHEKATVDCIAPPTSGWYGFCTKSESSAWHKGPYGVPLCDDYYLSLPEYKRMQALEEENRAELLRLGSLYEPTPASYFDVSTDGNIASSSTSAHKSSLKLPQLEGLPDAPFVSQNHRTRPTKDPSLLSRTPAAISMRESRNRETPGKRFERLQVDAKRKMARRRARGIQKPNQTRRCQTCGETGHNRTTCGNNGHAVLERKG